MAENTLGDVTRIISTVLHHIDLTAGACTHMPIANGDSDLEGYLGDLLTEIRAREQKRSFEFLRETTEFYGALTSFKNEQNLTVNVAASSLATRLLDKEVVTDARYGHLSPTGNGHVKKGSFLQFLYREGGAVSYLGVKVEHQSFLDEDDFKKKIGLSIANKIYKACKVTYDNNWVPTHVHVFDTNAKPASYWWQDFLELKEARTDSFNTRKASDEVMKLLNGIKREFPADHTILRNAAIAAFKQQGDMDYFGFVNKIFSSYVSDVPGLSARLTELVSDLKKLPEKKGFDSQFALVPSEIKFRKAKVELTNEISLSFDEGISDLDKKIWAEKAPDGRRLVVIDSPKGFDQFVLKERN